MSKNRNINCISIFIFVIIVLVLLVGICSYYVFFRNKSDSSIIFIHSDNNDIISIENSLPIEDSVGKLLSSDETNNKLKGYFEFVLSPKIPKNSLIHYEIVAEKVPANNEISDKYVKVYLSDGEYDLPVKGYNLSDIPTYAELNNSNIDSRYKVLYSGTFNNNKEKKFILRMWLADNYIVNDIDKKFSIRISVKVKN